MAEVDISYKIVSLQCYWIGVLYDDWFNEWKLISQNLITMPFWSKFKFDSNTYFKKTSL